MESNADASLLVVWDAVVRQVVIISCSLSFSLSDAHTNRSAAARVCLTNAGYTQNVLMCEEKRTHLASRIYDSMQIELHLVSYTIMVPCAAGF